MKLCSHLQQNVFFLLSLSWLINASPARRALDIHSQSAHILNDLQDETKVKNQDNVEATIQEVEKLLQEDASLPRLTRGEILDIIENLTRSDLQHKLTNNRDPKAVMVVMPYSADNVLDGNVEELYTKPPVTRIIGEIDPEYTTRDVPKKRPTKKPYSFQTDLIDVNNNVVKNANLFTTTELAISQNDQKSEQQQLQESVLDAVPQKARLTTENPFTSFIQRRRKPTKLPHGKQEGQSDMSSGFSTASTPIAENENISKRRKVTRMPTSTSAPITKTQPQIILRAPTEFPETGIIIVDPPKFNKLPEKNVISFQPLPPKPSTVVRPSNKLKPSPTTSKPVLMVVDDVQIPQDFKDVLKSLDILIKQAPTEENSYGSIPTTISYPVELSDDDKLKLLLSSLGGGQTTTTTTTAEPDVVQVANNLTPEMRELLMTFGLIPDPNKDRSTTPKPEIFMEPSSIINPESYTSFKPLPGYFDTKPNNEMEDLLTKFGLVGPASRSKNNREQKAISNFADSSNDMMDIVPDKFIGVISDIGLLNEALHPAVTTSTAPSTEPEHVFSPTEPEPSYASPDEINRLNQLMAFIKQFETLNGTATDEDMKHIDLIGLADLLQSFNVPLNEQNVPNPLDFDTSISKNEVKRETTTLVPTTIEETKTSLTTTTEKSPDEINRLNQLMAVIKQFETLNGTATDEDMKHIDLKGLADLVQSFNVPLNEQNVPNLLDFDTSISKNEVKRETTTLVPTTIEETKTTLTTSTEKSSSVDNPSLALLEDSFGGSSDTVPQESLPSSEAPPRTGFYYLVDWNSFFDIDNQKGKRVNLRFQPKIGDPKRFISVTVP